MTTEGRVGKNAPELIEATINALYRRVPAQVILRITSGVAILLTPKGTRQAKNANAG